MKPVHDDPVRTKSSSIEASSTACVGFDIASHVEVLSVLRDHEFEDAWYDEGNLDNFWMQWRHRVFDQMLHEVATPTSSSFFSVLDIGGGRGVLRQQLELSTAWTIDECDLDLRALASNCSDRGRTMYYDVLEMRSELVERYDAIIVFDVLEHIVGTGTFLQCALAHLKPGGFIFVNVPALQVFHSAYDVAVGHVRRYKRSSLKCEFLDLPVDVIDVRYWGFSLLPLLVLRRILAGKKVENESERKHIIERGFKPGGGAVEVILRTLMLETHLLSRPPLGTSLMLCGRKQSRC